MRGTPDLLEIPPPRVIDPRAGVVVDGVAMAAAVAVWADRLDALGVDSGAVVALQLANRWESIAALRACWLLGLVAFPIHHRLGTAERDRLVDRAGARVLVEIGDKEPTARAVDHPVAEVDDDLGRPSPDGRPLALLLATSGSTGEAKLVRHTHAGLGRKAATMVAAHGLTGADVVLMPAPLSHISGMLNGILLPGSAGMTTVLMDRWDPAAAVALIAEHRVSFMIGPPTFFLDLRASPAFTSEAVASLRLISCGGSTVTPAFVRETADAFGAVVKRTYGSTEAPTVTTWCPGNPIEHAATTDGRPTDGVTLRLVDPMDETQPLESGTGALQVSGSEVCDGYTQRAATTEAFTGDGWYRTGDLATISPDGWLTIVGRVGSTIIRGGENISPAAVEAVCDAIPGVGQSAVIGVPDERLGQRVVVVVEDDVDLPAVQGACEAAGLAKFSWPEQVVRVHAIPRLAAGKPDRDALLREVLANG